MKTTRTASLAYAILFLFFSNVVLAIPQLSCPADVWLDCDDPTHDLYLYGNATYIDDYGNSQTPPTPTVEYFLNNCNTGMIVRTWTIEDANWNLISCSQTIYIVANNFKVENIEWPNQEVILEGCNPDTDPNNFEPEDGFPTYDWVDCSFIGVNYKDQTFNIGPDCRKILRTWTVIDWCTYHPSYNSTQGIWRFSQTLKIVSDESPELICLPDISVNSFNCTDAYVTLIDQLPPDSDCGGTYAITHNSIYADTTGANASGTYPIGETWVRYEMAYGCGFPLYCSQKITVLDQIAPVPYCFAELNIVLMGMDEDGDGINDNGMVEIWAKDLDAGSFHSCPNRGPLHFSFSEDVDSTFRVFTCDEVGLNDVKMYVTDRYGNQSYCLVRVDVQNNGANIQNCSATATVTTSPQLRSVEGEVSTHDGEALEEAYLTLFAMEPDMEISERMEDRIVEYYDIIIDSFYNTHGETVYNTYQDSMVQHFYDTIYTTEVYDQMSSIEGGFNFQALDATKQYKLLAKRFTTSDRHINYFDAKAMLDHLSGKHKFTDAYQLIAADINFDKRVNVNDLMMLIQYINGQEDLVPVEERWQFVSADLEMDMGFVVPSFDEFIMVDETEENMNKAFIAICIGDISADQYASKTEADFEQLVIESRKLENPIVSYELKFAPNPFVESTSMVLNNWEAGTYNLQILDALGHLVSHKTFSVSETNQEIPIAIEGPSGLYFYKIEVNQEVIAGRLIKI